MHCCKLPHPSGQFWADIIELVFPKLAVKRPLSGTKPAMHSLYRLLRRITGMASACFIGDFWIDFKHPPKYIFVTIYLSINISWKGHRPSTPAPTKSKLKSCRHSETSVLKTKAYGLKKAIWSNVYSPAKQSIAEHWGQTLHLTLSLLSAVTAAP